MATKIVVEFQQNRPQISTQLRSTGKKIVSEGRQNCRQTPRALCSNGDQIPFKWRQNYPQMATLFVSCGSLDDQVLPDIRALKRLSNRFVSARPELESDDFGTGSTFCEGIRCWVRKFEKTCWLQVPKCESCLTCASESCGISGSLS
jgi:hypothetical protein